MTHDYDAMTRAIKDAPLTKQLQIIREIVEAKDFQDFTSDALYQLDETLDDMDAQAVDMLRQEDFGTAWAGGSVMEWQPIETAPKDGTAIQACIWANGSDNVIAWHEDALLGSDGLPCGAWAFVSEQEPPACWTDGWCWEINEDGEHSAKPMAWMPLPEGGA